MRALGNSGGVMGVQPDVLLRGAWYALEQSGLLLTNAIGLYSTKGYASAVLLALLAREELGRCRILLDLWRKASLGIDVSVGEVQQACDDHVEKQRQGQLSTTYHLQGSSGLAKLLQERSKAEPGTSQRANLDKQVKEVDERKTRRTPEDRHSTRMKAMYVDLNETGTDWNRPQSLSQREADNCLTDAINDYSIKRSHLTELEILRTSDRELEAAIGAWSDRPLLPQPSAIWRERTPI